MIYFLRNISIRLYIATLISIPITFTIFPAVQTIIININITIFSIVFTLFMLIINGYIMNILGKRSIDKYINEAKSWERDGVFHKSEACYLKALEIFDSYLLTILTSKKVSIKLTGSIAKFSLTAGWYNEPFDKAAIFFLLKNPKESEVAYLWLKKIVKQKTIDSSEENLINLLAETEPLDQKIAALLAEIFRQNKRFDFTAQRVFSFVDKNFGYFETPLAISDNIKVSENNKIPENNNIELEKTSKDFKRAKRYSFIFKVKRFDTAAIKRTVFTIKERLIWIFSIPMHLISFIIEVVEWIFDKLFFSSFKRITLAIKLNSNFRNKIKKAIIVIITLGFIMLFINTVSYLFKPPVSPTVSSSSQKIVSENSEVQVVPQKQFTIQVAAYLVKSHAEKYLSKIEAKGVSDGYITEVEGGGKIWYLIRVGKYETKEIAAEEGNKLKSKQLINDFFVDNSSG